MAGFIICAAPLQGYTEAAWRCFHNSAFPGVDCYFTPFIRIEKGLPRKKDIRDASSPFNAGVNVVPQIIFNDIDGFRTLCDSVVQLGFTRVDLNLGCPFPPQVKHGYGAGTLASPRLIGQVAECIAADRRLSFSVKMRLGIDDCDQWRHILPELNSVLLTHITVHPRTAVQQYRGDLNLDSFSRLLETSAHPVIFNGELKTSADIDAVRASFPSIAGVMLGRGLLSSPWIAAEYASGNSIAPADRLSRFLDMHAGIFGHYQSTLCGDSQILAKLKPFWEYPAETLLELGAPRKILKSIHKAGSLNAYTDAVSALRLWAASL